LSCATTTDSNSRMSISRTARTRLAWLDPVPAISILFV